MRLRIETASRIELQTCRKTFLLMSRDLVCVVNKSPTRCKSFECLKICVKSIAKLVGIFTTDLVALVLLCNLFTLDFFPSHFDFFFFFA